MALDFKLPSSTKKDVLDALPSTGGALKEVERAVKEAGNAMLINLRVLSDNIFSVTPQPKGAEVAVIRVSERKKTGMPIPASGMPKPLSETKVHTKRGALTGELIYSVEKDNWYGTREEALRVYRVRRKAREKKK